MSAEDLEQRLADARRAGLRRAGLGPLADIDEQAFPARTGPSFQLPPDLLETIEEQAERAEREAPETKRRAAAKRLCSLAVLAVDSLREGSPKLRQEVEAAIHSVGDAVEKLAIFESAVRRYQEPTAEQRKAAAAVIEHAPLGWALENVEKLVRAEQREREAKRR